MFYKTYLRNPTQTFSFPRGPMRCSHFRQRLVGYQQQHRVAVNRILCTIAHYCIKCSLQFLGKKTFQIGRVVKVCKYIDFTSVFIRTFVFFLTKKVVQTVTNFCNQLDDLLFQFHKKKQSISAKPEVFSQLCNLKVSHHQIGRQ